MNINNFELSVLEAQHETQDGYVELDHGQVYSLHLRNNHVDRDCDAQISIDGKDVGTFRIYKHSGLVLQRPVHDTGRLTFYESASYEASQSGEQKVDKQDRGLIQVTFKASYSLAPSGSVVRPISTTGLGFNSTTNLKDDGHEATCTDFDSYESAGATKNYAAGGQHSKCSRSAPHYSSGVTGLSGRSSQQFRDAAPLVYDESKTTVISLRLVVAKKGPRELTPACKGNPVPATVN